MCRARRSTKLQRGRAPHAARIAAARYKVVEEHAAAPKPHQVDQLELRQHLHTRRRGMQHVRIHGQSAYRSQYADWCSTVKRNTPQFACTPTVHVQLNHASVIAQRQRTWCSTSRSNSGSRIAPVQRRRRAPRQLRWGPAFRPALLTKGTEPVPTGCGGRVKPLPTHIRPGPSPPVSDIVEWVSTSFCLKKRRLAKSARARTQ